MLLLIVTFIVVVLALLDLQKLLAAQTDVHGFPMDLPQHVMLQFDNCRGENKVYCCDIYDHILAVVVF